MCELMCTSPCQQIINVEINVLRVGVDVKSIHQQDKWNCLRCVQVQVQESESEIRNNRTVLLCFYNRAVVLRLYVYASSHRIRSCVSTVNLAICGCRLVKGEKGRKET